MFVLFAAFFKQEPVVVTAPTNDNGFGPHSIADHFPAEFAEMCCMSHMDATEKCQVLTGSFIVNLGQWLININGSILAMYRRDSAC